MISRQSESTFRIHYGEFAAEYVGAVVFLQFTFVVGDDTAITHFAASSRNGKYCGYGQAGFSYGFTEIKVPYVTFIRYSDRDGFSRIDDTAATHSKDKIHTFFPAEFHAFAYFRYTRIGHHTTQCNIGNACFLKRTADRIK